MKPWAEKFYKSKAWRQCRHAYSSSQHGLCERCGSAGWIVHHKIYLTPGNINSPEITLNWINLELLCLDCHNREHGGATLLIRKGSWRCSSKVLGSFFGSIQLPRSTTP
ncbi:MAG TPA: HNH endonuclease [Firmicutes bacterium]|nr:HNH endonuclease [Bacillota bacterium]